MSNKLNKTKTFQEKILEADIELINFLHPDPIEGDEIGVIKLFRQHRLQKRITFEYKFNRRKWKYVETHEGYMPL